MYNKYMAHLQWDSKTTSSSCIYIPLWIEGRSIINQLVSARRYLALISYYFRCNSVSHRIFDQNSVVNVRTMYWYLVPPNSDGTSTGMWCTPTHPTTEILPHYFLFVHATSKSSMTNYEIQPLHDPVKNVPVISSTMLVHASKSVIGILSSRRHTTASSTLDPCSYVFLLWVWVL